MKGLGFVGGMPPTAAAACTEFTLTAIFESSSLSLSAASAAKQAKPDKPKVQKSKTESLGH